MSDENKTTSLERVVPAQSPCRQLPVNSMQDIAVAGELIARSGMLGAKNPAEGFLIAATCLQEGMSFLKFGEKYNVIAGRISIKAEAMLAKLLELGGDYKVLDRSADKASLKLRFREAEFVSTLTWEEAQNESYTRAKDGKSLKDNWSTPRRRAQMLWARAVSDGVRVVCPLATQGTYTPEEVMDFDDPRPVSQVGEVIDLPAVAPTPVAASAAAPAPQPESAPATMAATPRQAQPSAATKAASMQMPSVTAGTPFDIPPAQPDVDYSVCRATGIFQGKPWRDVPTDQLKLALNIISPAITAGDHAVIKQIIQERG